VAGGLGRDGSVQSTGKSNEQRWVWETGVIPDDQEVEATPVARFAGARCSGALEIPHRS
jgi:hypothetical protein